MFLWRGNGAPVSVVFLQQVFAEGKKKPQGLGIGMRHIGVKSPNDWRIPCER